MSLGKSELKPRWRWSLILDVTREKSARNGFERVPPNNADAAKRNRFVPTAFGDVSLDAAPTYLVKGLIPRGGLTVVWGPPKCGKSFWVFDLVMHVARGMAYRGRRVKQGSVIYLALEGCFGFRARIEAYRCEHGGGDWPFYLITDRTDLVRDHRVLAEAIAHLQPALIVIDTLNRSLAGSESKDEDMSAYVRASDAIRDALQCAVVVIHHCGVDATRPRGHTSLTAACDAQIAVSRDASGNITAAVEWMKEGAEGDEIVSRLQRVVIGKDDDGEEISSCLITPADGVPRAGRRGRPAHKGKGERVFEDSFNEAMINSARAISVRGDGPLVRATLLEHVKAQFDLRYVTGEKDPVKAANARRMAFQRVLAKLPPKYATWAQTEKEWIWDVTKQPSRVDAGGL